MSVKEKNTDRQEFWIPDVHDENTAPQRIAGGGLMKSFMPLPRRMILWRCPGCGRKTTSMERHLPWLLTRVPFFSGTPKPPVCPKCKKKMEQIKLFYK